jgi:hypothetical protein
MVTIKGVFMELLESLLEKGLVSEFRLIIEDINDLDKMTFFKKYIDINEKYDTEDNFGWYNDIIDFNKKEILIKTKEYISQWLEVYGVKNFEWTKNKLKKNNGEDLGLTDYEIFRKLNRELDAIQYKVVFIDRRDEGYLYFFIISNEKFSKINLDDELFGELKEFQDISEYELYLLTTTMNIGLKNYLRAKFSLKINEINDFVKEEKILIETGSKTDIKFYEDKIKNLGGEIEITEIPGKVQLEEMNDIR